MTHEIVAVFVADAVDAAVVECQCRWSVLAVAALVASRHVSCDFHAYAAAVWRKLLVITSAGLFGWLVWLVGWLVGMREVGDDVGQLVPYSYTILFLAHCVV